VTVKKVVQVANIRYHGEGAKLLLGYTISAQKQIGKKDIYQHQHWNGLTDGYAYKVPRGVYSNTPEQNQTRLRLRASMLAWNRLADSEKDDWKKKAEGRPLMGHNLFARWWFKNHGFGVSAFGVTAFGDSSGSLSKKG